MEQRNDSDESTPSSSHSALDDTVQERPRLERWLRQTNAPANVEPRTPSPILFRPVHISHSRTPPNFPSEPLQPRGYTSPTMPKARVVSQRQNNVSAPRPGSIGSASPDFIGYGSTWEPLNTAYPALSYGYWPGHTNKQAQPSSHGLSANYSYGSPPPMLYERLDTKGDERLKGREVVLGGRDRVVGREREGRM